MRKSYFLVIGFFLIISMPVFCQNNSVPGELSLAFRTANVEKITDYFNSTVELIILNKEDFYSKKAAKNILSNFFTTYTVKDFSIKHQGGQNNANFAIATLTTTNNTFRVFFLIKWTASKAKIYQLRIEKDDSKGNS